MDKKLENLHELCETLNRDLEETNAKIRKNGGKLSSGDVEYVDKLTHAIKSLKTTIAMMESDDGGYSNRYMPYYGGGYGSYMGNSYADSMDAGRGNSYAGRRNARHDSMGRYSRGYSYADGMEELLGEMRDMLPGLSDEKRRKAEQLINELR